MRPTGPLMVLTIGQGIAGGLSLLAALLISMGGIAPVRIDILVLLALVAAGTGGVASFFHMHQIKAARYVLRRLKTSWLSREALTTGLFGGALAIFAAWSIFVGQHGALYIAWAWISVATALLAMWVTAMLYATIPAMLSWHTPITVLSFLMVGMLSGAGVGAIVAPLAKPELHVVVLAMLLWAVATLLIKLLHWGHFDRARHNLRAETATGLPFAPFRLQDTGTTKPPYRTQTQVWPVIVERKRQLLRWLTVVFLVVGVMVFLGLILVTRTSIWGIAVAMTAFTGTILERWLFFAESTHSSQVFFLDQQSAPSRVPTRGAIPLPIRKTTTHGQ